MTGKATDCTGCAYTSRRLKASKPKIWCTRYHRLAPEARCIDYRTKTSAIKAAINFFKTAGGR
jgi:hypothetical protein